MHAIGCIGLYGDGQMRGGPIQLDVIPSIQHEVVVPAWEGGAIDRPVLIRHRDGARRAYQVRPIDANPNIHILDLRIGIGELPTPLKVVSASRRYRHL